MILRIYSGSNAYIPTFGTLYSSSGVATLPTSLVASKTVTLGFQYDSGRSLWVLLAIDSTGY